MGSGTLLKETPAFVVAGTIEAETSVSWYLLRDDEDFVKMIRKADSLQEAIEWIEENY